MNKFFVVLVVLATLLIVDHVSLPRVDEAYTEFYFLGSDGSAGSLPRVTTAGEEMAVTVGIVNKEESSRTYDLELSVADAQDLEHPIYVKRFDPLSMTPGQGAEIRVSWRSPKSSGKELVRVVLLKEDGVTPYRRLQLWLDVTPP